MKTVGEVLQAKGRDIWSISPDATVYDALKLMAEKDVGGLLVIAGEKLVGIITERDYARKIILQGRSSVGTFIRDVMTQKVVNVRPEQSMKECMRLMTDVRVRHLAVLDNDQVVGLISIGDVLKEIMSESR